MPSGRASVPFPQRWRLAHGIPTLARGNEENEKKWKHWPGGVEAVAAMPLS